MEIPLSLIKDSEIRQLFTETENATKQDYGYKNLKFSPRFFLSPSGKTLFFDKVMVIATPTLRLLKFDLLFSDSRHYVIAAKKGENKEIDAYVKKFGVSFKSKTDLQTFLNDLRRKEIRNHKVGHRHRKSRNTSSSRYSRLL
eukprot:GHVP01013194.1.p1 GENE.GHVP01013194.1~~GHVP01013194.1.p1  ORF type:complete len:142 (-),score=19.68 GHVP01013194.1:100-525(-)